MSLLKSWPDFTAGRAARHIDTENILGALTTVTAPTYSPTIATDASVQQFVKITATDTVAFTISNPSNAKAGMELIFDILNSSGGTMGTVTWDTLFKLAGSFTNPANGKRRTIAFYFDSANWVELSRAPADI